MMIFSIKNPSGVTTSLIPSADFTVTRIDGLTPPQVNINTTQSASLDGSVFNSAAARDRNIVINMAVHSPAEENRLKLYAAAPIKKLCTFYAKTAARDVKILGYIEACEVNIFDQIETAQISAICPDPWFSSVTDETVNISDSFTDFTNAGDIPCGAEFELTVGADELGVVVENGEYNFFEINYNFLAGDKILLNTKRGIKSVILRRGTTFTNLLNYVNSGSTWLQIGGGANRIKTSENVTGVVTYTPLFSGV
jgi:hypothetical protein